VEIFLPETSKVFKTFEVWQKIETESGNGVDKNARSVASNELKIKNYELRHELQRIGEAIKNIFVNFVKI
jgi:hypothetical protein